MSSVEIHDVSKQGGYVKVLLSELRNKHNIDPGIFGANLKTLGLIMGNELSKTLPYDETVIETPLAKTTGYKLAQPPVIGTILRAGLPLFEGVRQVFPQTNTIIVDSGRIENPDGSIGVDTRSVKGARVGGKVLILADTMLATGGVFACRHWSDRTKGRKTIGSAHCLGYCSQRWRRKSKART